MADDVTRVGDAEFQGLPGTQALGDALYLSGPYKVADAPNAYSFARSNTIKIDGSDWNDLLKKIGVPVTETNSALLRAYVEETWKLKTTPDSTTITANTFDLTEDWPAYVPDTSSARNAVPTGNDHPTFFSGRLSAYKLPPEVDNVIAIKSGCVLRVTTRSGTRWYQPIIDTDSKVDYPLVSAFQADWVGCWDKVTALVQVFFPGEMPTDQKAKDSVTAEAVKKSKTEFPAVENIRADAATIDRQYRSLRNEDALATSLSAKADNISNVIQTSQVEVIPALIAQYRDLKNFGSELQAKKRQLADAASDLNFHLFTAPKTITVYQDGSGAPVPLELKEGDLYVKSSRTACWTTYQTVTNTSSGLFGIGASSRSWQVPVYNSKTFDYYEEAVIDYDPWIEVLELYKSKGYSTFLFQFSEHGLHAADGSTPSEILKLCQENEDFRVRCIIALPQKEITLIGETFVVGYNLFVRPVPDIVVTSFPEISLRERLSYRFTWAGVSLGELATTIPLSPGEQREVTLKTSERYNSTRSETATSLVDITRIDRADFETVFEKEVRKENETTTSFSGGLSGSYAGISGSANFSKTNTTKEVARQLNRSVQRASQEVNRRSKTERTITVSESIETTRDNTTTFRVRNINEGSTLNIAFYRLYNAFESILKLDEFEYIVRGGRSIFASTDLVDEMVFARDELSVLVTWLAEEGHFPFDITHLTSEQKLAFSAELHAIVLEKYKEYPPKNSDGKSTNHDSEDGDTKVLAVADGNSSRNDRITELQEKFRKVADALINPTKRTEQADITYLLLDKKKLDDELTNLPFWQERTSFAYDSGGLYADVYVGQRPATETYSENMRRLEEGRVLRENRLLDARASSLEARVSKQIIGLGGIIDASKVFVTDRDTFIMKDGHVELKLRLVPGLLWNRGWTLILASQDKFSGGSFLQEATKVDGILIFKLPRRFSEGDSNIINRPHTWFKQNVTLRNEDLAFTIKYKEP
ncbi:hypothetical protein ACQCN7_21655 [Escherichia coli]